VSDARPLFLILDGNNLAWAGYYALERVMKPDDDERRRRVALLGLAGGVLGAIGRAGEPPGAPAPTPVGRVAICFDEGRPLRRRKIFAPYQTGRERDPKFIAYEPIVLAAIAEFAAACAALPVDVVRGKNTEADDLIAGLVQANPDARKRIVSTDRDFLQLIDASTSVYAPVKKLVIDESNFDDCVLPKGATRVSLRSCYVDYRALTGDTSDDLPGVPGIGPLSAVKLLANGPLDAYFGDAARVRAALGRRSELVERAFAGNAAREIVVRNRTLMDLRLPAPCWDELDALTTRGAWDRPAFQAWFDEQRFSGVDAPALLARLESLAEGRAAG
jgi:DNA polymerase-1